MLLKMNQGEDPHAKALNGGDQLQRNINHSYRAVNNTDATRKRR